MRPWPGAAGSSRSVRRRCGPWSPPRAPTGWCGWRRGGRTDLVVTPGRGVRVVQGLLTGLHEPEASRLLMMQAAAGREAVRRSCAEALDRRYLWHEFGDVLLIRPEEHGRDAGNK